MTARCESFELQNGLRVFMQPDPRIPLVAINLCYQVGAIHEPPGRTGLAHLCEHLMFMGTERVPHFDLLMEAVGGSNNAATSEDRTIYYAIGPGSALSTLLWLEAERMDGFAQAMSQEKLDLQREVVLNERRQVVDDEPYGRVPILLGDALYASPHPYRHPVIGWVEDICAITVQDVRDFFERYYAPSNATLAIVGDFDLDQSRRELERFFSPIATRPRPLSAPLPPAVLDAERHLRHVDSVPQARLHLAWHSPSYLQPGDAELDVCCHILSQGRNARLNRRLMHEQQLATSVEAVQASGSASILLLEFTAGEEVALDTLRAEVDEELRRLCTDGVSQEELDRARNHIETDFVRQAQSLQRRADLLNQYQFYANTPEFLEPDRERYRALDTEAVRRSFQAVLEQPRVVLEVQPLDAAEEQTPV
ncbi:MAG: pitrilysin family protein [Myxococcota bacterium]|jgi:zinc protease|nr:pitrilysin family protein [Myxococcota bacterium]